MILFIAANGLVVFSITTTVKQLEAKRFVYCTLRGKLVNLRQVFIGSLGEYVVRHV